MRFWHLVTLAGLAAPRDCVRAQDVSVTAQAIPLVTRADPTAARAILTEGYLTQPVVMGHAAWMALRGVATVDLEGFTLERGELSTGAFGEGYVDRRHPHTYVHELLAGVESTRGWLQASLFAGRGFVPFGSDDPMSRPLEKYPVNHHLSQVLERLVAVAAIRHGPVIVEGATFNGDEPISPSSMPRWGRFGDSWSARLTVLPIDGGELAASIANLTSPEVPLGLGLDQRKASVVARFDRRTPTSWRYALAEWANTDELDRGVKATSLSTLLAEAAYCRADIIGAMRLEQTDRPEEEQGLDPFRTPRPPVDLTNLGVSRWTTLTVAVSAPAVTKRFFTGRPFVEVAHVSARAADPDGLFSAERRYGASRMWMASVGIRLRAGPPHPRMGRYGVAVPTDMHVVSGTPMHQMGSHQMPSSAPTSPIKCSL